MFSPREALFTGQPPWLDADALSIGRLTRVAAIQAGMKAPLDEFEPCSRAEWRRWLAEHHSASPGIWLIWHTRRSGQQQISVGEAVLEALCFGWIDSQLRRLDATTRALRFTPRKRGGTWSHLNRQRVEDLISSGLMTESGMRAIEAAHQDGSWSILDDVDDLRVPNDFRQALDADAEARRNFDAFAPSSRKMALWWILSARRPATRARRVSETVRLAADNNPVIPPYRQQARNQRPQRRRQYQSP
jgi:uncharacterized protein YdeI (YjbR/CyaY-like superfamily)